MDMSMISTNRCQGTCRPRTCSKTRWIVCLLKNLECSIKIWIKDFNLKVTQSLSTHRTCVRWMRNLTTSILRTDTCMRGKRLLTFKRTCMISKGSCQVNMFLHSCVHQCIALDMRWCRWVALLCDRCTTTDRAIRCTITKCRTTTWDLPIWGINISKEVTIPRNRIGSRHTRTICNWTTSSAKWAWAIICRTFCSRATRMREWMTKTLKTKCQ